MLHDGKTDCKCLNRTAVHFFNVLISVMPNQINQKIYILISPCYFNMNGCFLYKNVIFLLPLQMLLEKIWKPASGCFYFIITSNVWITNVQLVMYFPVRGKLKYVGPSLDSLSQLSENLRKSLYKIENSSNLWKLWDFFYLLFLIRAGL